MEADSSSSESSVRIVYTERPERQIKTVTSVLCSEDAAKEALCCSYNDAANGFSAKQSRGQGSQFSIDCHGDQLDNKRCDKHGEFSNMATLKYEVEKFTGSNDFGLWRIKMKALLVLEGLVDALGGEDNLDPTIPEETRNTILEKAHSAIILSLGDKVLRQVFKEKSAAGVWAKLERLYMPKSRINRLYLKRALYSFKMSEEKPVMEQLDMFNKLIFDLNNIEVEIDDENLALLLLLSLPKSYDHFTETLLYSRNTLSLDEVQAMLISKELIGQRDLKVSSSVEGLSPSMNGNYRSKYSSKNGCRSSHVKCYFCNKEGHFHRFCPERHINDDRSN